MLNFYLSNYDCIMVEILNKKTYCTKRQHSVISEEQRQQSNAYVLKFPGPLVGNKREGITKKHNSYNHFQKHVFKT